MKILPWILLVSLSVSACVSTDGTQPGLISGKLAPISKSQVAIYRTAAQVPGPYEEVALLNSVGDHWLTDEQRMFDSLRSKAAQMGANGVIVDAVSEPGSGAKVPAAFLGISAQRKGKAVAILVREATTVGPATGSASTMVVYPGAQAESAAAEVPTGGWSIPTEYEGYLHNIKAPPSLIGTPRGR